MNILYLKSQPINRNFSPNPLMGYGGGGALRQSDIRYAAISKNHSGDVLSYSSDHYFHTPKQAEASERRRGNEGHIGIVRVEIIERIPDTRRWKAKILKVVREIEEIRS